MGLTHVTTTVRNLAGRGKGFAAEFLVDTGALHCLAPAKALRKVGIKPEGKNIYELAGGPFEKHNSRRRMPRSPHSKPTFAFNDHGYSQASDGSPVELEYGFARVSLMGDQTVTPIIFAPDGSEPILGVLALDGLGISVDPKTRSLKRERAISLK